MISGSKVILFPLKVIILTVSFPKVSPYGIMATRILAMLTTIHHSLNCGIVVYLVNPRHRFHSIPLHVCFVSQLERCCYVSFLELILSCLTFNKIDPFRLFPILSLSCGLEFSEQDDEIR